MPSLIEVLRKEDDPSLRASAAFALGGLGRPIEPTAMPVLIAALRDKDERVRSSAATTLAAHRPVTDKALPALLEMLASDQHPGTAIDALAAMGPAAKAAVPSLIVLLKDRKQNAQVRASAATALSRIGSADGPFIQALVEGLQEDGLNAFWVANACEGAVAARRRRRPGIDRGVSRPKIQGPKARGRDPRAAWWCAQAMSSRSSPGP